MKRQEERRKAGTSRIQGSSTMRAKSVLVMNMFLMLMVLAFCGTGCRNSNGGGDPAGNASSATVSRVETQNNVPTLFINNIAVAPTSLFVYNVEHTVNYGTAEWITTFKGYVDKAKNTGVTYISFEVYLHASMFATPTQPGVNGSEIDFSGMDALFDYAQSKGIYLLPTLWISKPPEWWEAQHQDEMQHSYDLPPKIDDAVSFNNPDYWQVMDEYVKVIVERYKSHPALLGWSPCLGVSQENNYGPSYITYPTATSWSDYSSYAKGRFRDWLMVSYLTDTALRAAWNDPAVTLATAGPPLPQNAVTTPPESIANDPGDTRPQMTDWLSFRLHEKGAEWEHFIDLVKTLDPDHILAINPAGALFSPIGAVTRNGSADGLEWTRSSRVDMVIIHPRISFDETPGPWNTQNYSLYSFVASARRSGKLATFALEDNGEAANNGNNVESLERIKSLSSMLAAAGSGVGWSVEAGGKLPVWSDVELAEVAKYTALFDPARRAVTIPKVAILLDPRNEQAEYTLGATMDLNSRTWDRINFHASLYNAGIELDPVEATELVVDPQLLNNYSGVVVANMARLNSDVAQILHDYAQSGGGLFIAGRNGIFDNAGNADLSAFKTLAGLSDLPEIDTASYPTWSFDASADPLLAGISGQTVDTGNLFYIPLADWPGNGYAELGHAASGTNPATLLKKDKIVIWLPRLDLPDDDLIVSLFQNWMAVPDSVGFIGCSLSINAMNGYRSLGGTRLCPGSDTGYAGGGLSVWVSQLKSGSSQGDYWSKFSAMLAQYPGPRAIWWELCPNADAAAITYEDTLSVLNELKRLAPDAKVYVTGVPIYPLDGTHCSINTDLGSQATLDLAGQLVSNNEALRGPVLSPLTSAQVADGCHANTEGEAIWGNDLLGFFGK